MERYYVCQYKDGFIYKSTARAGSKQNRTDAENAARSHSVYIDASKCNCYLADKYDFASATKMYC